MNYGLLVFLKLARIDVGNVSKKGENMEGIKCPSAGLGGTITIPVMCWSYSKQ